jgi:hypothetical protein
VGASQLGPYARNGPKIAREIDVADGDPDKRPGVLLIFDRECRYERESAGRERPLETLGAGHLQLRLELDSYERERCVRDSARA